MLNRLRRGERPPGTSSPEPASGHRVVTREGGDGVRAPEGADGHDDYYVSVLPPDRGADAPTDAGIDGEDRPDEQDERSPHTDERRPHDSGRVICVTNQKGGVGKTTTAVSLAAALAERGARVLLIDLDPQGNATTGLGRRRREGGPSTYGVLIEELPVKDAIVPTDVPGLLLLPSSLDLAGAEIELVPMFTRERRLADALADVRESYDLVLLDCPPTLGLLTVNALVAADEVLLPIQCEYYALEGVGQLVRTIDLVRRSLNPDLEVGGVVLTMFDGRTRLSEQVANEVRGHFDDRVFRTVIPRSVRLSEAPGFGQPITTFDPASRAARAYQRLATELAGRLGLDVDGASDVLGETHRREGPAR